MKENRLVFRLLNKHDEIKYDYVDLNIYQHWKLGDLNSNTNIYFYLYCSPIFSSVLGILWAIYFIRLRIRSKLKMVFAEITVIIGILVDLLICFSL
jgi:hypothetical protein